MAPKAIHFIAILAFVSLFLLGGIGIWHSYYLQIRETHIPEVRYRGEASPEWNIGDLGRVRMLVENTIRYRIHTEDGTKEWEHLIPENSGVITLPNPETGELEQYTIALFHELRCLNVLRLELVRPTRLETRAPNEPLVKHCLNYVRQMALCRSDLYSWNIPDPTRPTGNVTHINTCKDWRRVYEATKVNQRRFSDLGNIEPPVK